MLAACGALSNPIAGLLESAKALVRAMHPNAVAESQLIGNNINMIAHEAA